MRAPRLGERIPPADPNLEVAALATSAKTSAARARSSSGVRVYVRERRPLHVERALRLSVRESTGSGPPLAEP